MTSICVLGVGRKVGTGIGAATAGTGPLAILKSATRSPPSESYAVSVESKKLEATAAPSEKHRRQERLGAHAECRRLAKEAVHGVEAFCG